jgi:acyl-CoA thioester hydrolase
MTEAFEFPIRVLPEHIDALGHVNNVVYVQWIQDAAAAHWNVKALPDVNQRFKWVVVRHEVDYKSPAFLNEELIAKTWVESYEGVRSVRRVQISRLNDSKLVAEASTTWCLLNAGTGRPTRITDEIRSVFLPTGKV